MLKANELSYCYRTFEKQTGFLGTLKDFISRKYITVQALKGLDFMIEQGEFIGLLGANGAGKTTLIKVLTGILKPTNGFISCNGFNPYERKKSYLKNIGVVLGQKSQLIWDLPAKETLEMIKVIYEIDQEEYRDRLKRLC